MIKLISNSNMLIAMPISKRSFVIVELSGDITQDSIKRLCEHLKLSQDAFPTESEIDESEKSCSQRDTSL